MTSDSQQLAPSAEQLRAAFQQERRRFRVQVGLALFVVIGAILLFPSNHKANAQQTGGLPALEKRVAALEAMASAQQTSLTNLQTALTNEIARAKAAETTLQANLDAETARAKAAEAALTNQVTALQTLTAPLSLSGTDFTFTGVNVHIVDGSGKTISASGLGNLTIGYNLNPDNSHRRTGSHNLILGDGNDYISSGGLVAGLFNFISGPYAAILGGSQNQATNNSAIIVGGTRNVASGYSSTVIGGGSNAATLDFSAVFGGQFNVASGYNSTISGGSANVASSYASTVSGGSYVTQSNLYGWSGGAYHTP